MIKRFVKLEFAPERVTEFMGIFHNSKDKIRGFDGCHEMKLHKSTTAENVLFTVSVWESEDHLNKYRHSELFIATWEKTKKCFNGKPEAWSLELVDGVPFS
ncbi:MAG: quinol monooxygenase YgiN [Sphingobacteriales bacterium]|jgi:quinol monooxygenase YgiN